MLVSIEHVIQQKNERQCDTENALREMNSSGFEESLAVRGVPVGNSEGHRAS